MSIRTEPALTTMSPPAPQPDIKNHKEPVMNTAPENNRSNNNGSSSTTTTTARVTRTVIAAVGLTIAVVLSACNPMAGQDETAQLVSNEAVTAPTPAQAGAAAAGASTTSSATSDLYTNSSTRAVVTVDSLAVYDVPNGTVIDALTGATDYGTTRVLLVEQTMGDWVRVRLPVRPNHRIGWVAAADVQLEEVEPVVHINLETRTLSVISGDDLVTQVTVAVGSDENPTPRGTFYVTDKLETMIPDGAYGPYALGLSGYSETLSEFAGGNGQIGMHGTDTPESLGQAVSHGCVRLPNDVVTWMADFLPLGTPVHIV